MDIENITFSTPEADGTFAKRFTIEHNKQIGWTDISYEYSNSNCGSEGSSFSLSREAAEKIMTTLDLFMGDND